MISDINQVTLVDIIAINEDSEAYAIRSVLESFNIQTRIHRISNVKHLVSLLQSKDYLYEACIICCHGSKEGLLVPKLSSELEAAMPFHDKLSAFDLSRILNLKDNLVINTGCCLGGKEFGKAFLSKGAKAYIGPRNYIEGYAVILFVVMFLYFYHVKALSLPQSFNKAKYLDEETEMMNLWQREIDYAL